MKIILIGGQQDGVGHDFEGHDPDAALVIQDGPLSQFELYMPAANREVREGRSVYYYTAPARVFKCK